MMKRNKEMIPSVKIPEGQKGPWKIDRVTVSEQDSKILRLRSLFGRPRTYIPAGTVVTRLLRNGGIVMSDAPQERMDHRDAVRRARGNVLVTGLGLGMVLQAMAMKSEVRHISVIEISRDLIDLVGPYYQKKFGEKITINEGDAFTFKFSPEISFDSAWHDIWNDICADNLPEMVKLKRRYAKICKDQAFWCEIECRRQKGKEGGWRYE